MRASPTIKHAAGQARPACLGVLMLDTRFPRLPGDVGNAASFAVATLHHRVRGAHAGKVVTSADALRTSGLAPRFITAARELVAQGATALTTSCGFLVLLQRELQAAVPVPLVSSSLLQLPGLLAREPRVGVLTISAASLGPEHLRSAGVPDERLADVIVQGVDPGGEFARCILQDREQMDAARAGRDLVEAAAALRARAPDLRSVVLECTNMPPHAAAIRAATGWLLRWLAHAPELQGMFALDENAAA